MSFSYRLTRALCLQEKKTSLHLAAEKGRLQVCEHLLELRADISALDNVSTCQRHNPLFAHAKFTFEHASPAILAWLSYCTYPSISTVNHNLRNARIKKQC